ncbi:MAG: hypothetical protein PCFJNLEI_03760 [Verrucomicrobiae bacterium]|nr:hypothetical protein [Verrucomicrobiae bacterium]
MKHILVLLTLALAIGCASMQSVMDSWIGQPEAKLLERYGAPDLQTTLPNGSRIYTWKRLWEDSRGMSQIGRQNFTVNSNGVITATTYQNLPKAIPGGTADHYSAFPVKRRG